MAFKCANNLKEEEYYVDGTLCSRYMPFFSPSVFAVSFLYFFHLILLGMTVLKYDPLEYEYIWKEI